MAIDRLTLACGHIVPPDRIAELEDRPGRLRRLTQRSCNGCLLHELQSYITLCLPELESIHAERRALAARARQRILLELTDRLFTIHILFLHADYRRALDWLAGHFSAAWWLEHEAIPLESLALTAILAIRRRRNPRPGHAPRSRTPAEDDLRQVIQAIITNLDYGAYDFAADDAFHVSYCIQVAGEFRDADLVLYPEEAVDTDEPLCTGPGIYHAIQAGEYARARWMAEQLRDSIGTKYRLLFPMPPSGEYGYSLAEIPANEELRDDSRHRVPSTPRDS